MLAIDQNDVDVLKRKPEMQTSVVHSDGQGPDSASTLNIEVSGLVSAHQNKLTFEACWLRGAGASREGGS